jgi:hypothetical protein
MTTQGLDILALLERDPAAGILAAADLREQEIEQCWLCGSLGAVALHNTATAQFGRNLWTAHRPESRSHPVTRCPVCSAHALAAVHHWRKLVERHQLLEEYGSLGTVRCCAMCNTPEADFPCDDLTDTVGEARAYLGGAP